MEHERVVRLGNGETVAIKSKSGHTLLEVTVHEYSSARGYWWAEVDRDTKCEAALRRASHLNLNEGDKK